MQTAASSPPDLVERIVQALRETDNLFQVSRDSGVSYQGLRNIRDGAVTDPRYSTLVKIAGALHIDL